MQRPTTMHIIVTGQNSPCMSLTTWEEWSCFVCRVFFIRPYQCGERYALNTFEKVKWWFGSFFFPVRITFCLWLIHHSTSRCWFNRNTTHSKWNYRWGKEFTRNNIIFSTQSSNIPFSLIFISISVLCVRLNSFFFLPFVVFISISLVSS